MRLVIFKIAKKIFGSRSQYINYFFIRRRGKKFLEQLKEKSREDSLEFAYANFSDAELFPTRELMWDYVISQHILNNQNGAYLEFGVFEGYSINYFSRRLSGFKFYGFDSFEGLEEDWYGHPGYKKGTFSLSGQLPKVDERVELIQGWFESTVPMFLESFTHDGKLVIHMDADTYKPTKFLLETLKSSLVGGTIIIFDEFYGYQNWRAHEFKAFQEFAQSNNLQFRYIAATQMQVAIIIL